MACDIQLEQSPNGHLPPSSLAHHRLQVQVVGTGDEVDGSFTLPTYSSRLHPVLGSQGTYAVRLFQLLAIFSMPYAVTILPNLLLKSRALWFRPKTSPFD